MKILIRLLEEKLFKIINVFKIFFVVILKIFGFIRSFNKILNNQNIYHSNIKKIDYFSIFPAIRR